MKIKYEFDNGEVTEVEVFEEIGAMIIDSRREEDSCNRKERRHCYSLDAITYEGIEYCTPDFTEEMFDDCEERDARVREAFSHLSGIQQHRLLMLANGASLRKIALYEGGELKTIRESVNAARNKFKKFF